MAVDLYFDENYGTLYEKIEGGVATSFLYESELGKISHQFILREIPSELTGGQKLYDIVSPYGYGGPVIEEVRGGALSHGESSQRVLSPDEPSQDEVTQKLVTEFETAFTQYCAEHSIVSEFVRFHPIVGNGVDFEKIYHSTWDRHTLGTNLKDFEDPVAAEFTKHCRKRIRQALNKGVTYKITEKPTDLSGFKEIYYDTMDRNEAGDYYYFDDEYFNNCIKYYGENLLLVEAIFEEKVIAAGMYFTYGKLIHIHLSGTRHEYLNMSPAYVLRYALALWGKEHGYEMIHHGGGRSNAPDDSLYLFKEQFATNTKFDFYVGRKVWMKDKYLELCEKVGADPDGAFFPAYRQRH